MKWSNLLEKFGEFSKYDKVYSEMEQCEKFNSHLLTRIIQVGVNAVTNYQYSRREVIELTPVPADTIEDVFEKKI